MVHAHKNFYLDEKLMENDCLGAYFSLTMPLDRYYYPYPDRLPDRSGLQTRCLSHRHGCFFVPRPMDDGTMKLKINEQTFARIATAVERSGHSIAAKLRASGDLEFFFAST
jgi:hypothetical protein